MIELDNLDRKLIGLLRQDGRESTAALAKNLNVSRATVRTRIERLIAAGVIEGFTIKLGAEIQKQLIRAIMLIKIEGTKSDYVVRVLNTIDEVVDLFSTSGQWDSIAILETDNLQHFDSVLRKISGIPGIKVTETSIMLTSRRNVRV